MSSPFAVNRLQSEAKENYWTGPERVGDGDKLERKAGQDLKPQSTVVTPEEEEDGIVQYKTEDIISPGTVHYNTVLNSLPSAEMLKHVESMSQYSAENSTSSAQFRNTQFSILSSPNTHENSVSSAQFRQAHPSSSVSSPVVQRNSFQGSPQQNRSSAQSSPLQSSRTRESSPASILYRREQIAREQFSSSDTLSLHQRATQNRRESSLRNAQNSGEPQNQLRTGQFSPMRGGQGSYESSPRTRQSSLASSELCPSSPTVQCRSSSTVQFSSPSLPASSVHEVSPLPGGQNLPAGNQSLAAQFPHCPSNLPTRSSWPDPGDPR